MNQINQESKHLISYDMQLRILTPVHIDNGQSLNRLDYYYDTEKEEICILDQAKWLQYLIRFDKLDYYVDQALRKDFNIYEWLKSIRIKKVTSTLQENGVIKQIIPFASANILKNTFSPFIRDGSGKLFIPGSSIKGALRSAIMSSWIRRSYNSNDIDKEKLSKIWNDLKDHVRSNNGQEKKFDSKAAEIMNQVNSLYFHERPNPTNDSDSVQLDPFRAIRVSDAYPLSKPETCIVQKIDIAHKNKLEKENRIPLWRESLTPESLFNFTITIDRSYLKACGLQDWASIENLLLLIKESRTHHRVTYEVPLKKEIKEKNEKLTVGQIMLKKGETTLFLGGGTGFVEKTLIYALDPPMVSKDADNCPASDLTREVLLRKFSTYPKSKFIVRHPAALKVFDTKQINAPAVKEDGSHYARLGVAALRWIQE